MSGRLPNICLIQQATLFLRINTVFRFWDKKKKSSDKRHYTAYFYWKMSSLNVQNVTNWILAQVKKSEETCLKK